MLYPHEITISYRPAARALWEQIFEEDTPEWLDMYEKLRADRVILGISEDSRERDASDPHSPSDGAYVFTGELTSDRLVSMLQLDPFQMIYGQSQPVRISYVVGVSTLPEYRHRGLMSTLLTEAMRVEAADGRPFMFLMPANDNIYLPFGFQTVYRQTNLTLAPGRKSFDESCLQTRLATHSDSTLLAELSTKLLSCSTDVYAQRDSAYFDFLIDEMAADGGEVRIIERAQGDGYSVHASGCAHCTRPPVPVGYLCFWPGTGLVVRELVSADPAGTAALLGLVPADHCPHIMIRALDLPALVKPLHSDTPLCIVLDYKDAILDRYTGRWLICIGTDGSTAEKLSNCEYSSADDLSAAPATTDMVAPGLRTTDMPAHAIHLSLDAPELVSLIFDEAGLPADADVHLLKNIKRPTRILLNEWI